LLATLKGVDFVRLDKAVYPLSNGRWLHWGGETQAYLSKVGLSRKPSRLFSGPVGNARTYEGGLGCLSTWQYNAGCVRGGESRNRLCKRKGASPIQTSGEKDRTWTCQSTNAIATGISLIYLITNEPFLQDNGEAIAIQSSTWLQTDKRKEWLEKVVDPLSEFKIQFFQKEM
jgi:hypothetical protein